MPTYDYECPKCGHEFEFLQNITDKPLSKCPKCNAGKVKRLIGSGSGIIFKGTGFYETDYKRKPSGKESKATSSSAKDNKSKDAAGEKNKDKEAPKTQKTENNNA
ncbi:MAG: FmdB family zinc ribbon protein [Candidatus Omnitrophota bacterium]